MRIVTIEGFGKGQSREHGFIYQGDAWLFRFATDSPDSFFAKELDHLIRTFEIDPRQIMELTLRGPGLHDIHVLISFDEEHPSPQKIEQLRNAVSFPQGDYNGYNMLWTCFRDLMRAANPTLKAGILKALKGTVESNVATPSSKSSARPEIATLHSFSDLIDGPPSVDSWTNLNFVISEALRDGYDLERFERVCYVPIPEAEDEYRISTQILMPADWRLHKVRRKLRRHRHLSPPREKPAHKEAIEFVVESHTEEEVSARYLLEQLSVKRKIEFWRREIAPFFQ